MIKVVVSYDYPFFYVTMFTTRRRIWINGKILGLKLVLRDKKILTWKRVKNRKCYLHRVFDIWNEDGVSGKTFYVDDSEASIFLQKYRYKEPTLIKDFLDAIYEDYSL